MEADENGFLRDVPYTGGPVLYISSVINNLVSPTFARKVLKKDIFDMVYLHNTSESIAFKVSGEIDVLTFNMHPRTADASIYRKYLNTLTCFEKISQADTELARQIVIAYSLYAEETPYSYYEDWLWETNQEDLRGVAATVGIPTGIALQELKNKHDVRMSITKSDVIAVLLDLEDIAHCLPSGKVCRFLLDIRDKSRPTHWIHLTDTSGRRF